MVLHGRQQPLMTVTPTQKAELRIAICQLRGNATRNLQGLQWGKLRGE